MTRVGDRATTLLVAFGFSLALGVGTVTIPLVALAAGYDAATIGFLAATAAATQLVTRIGLPWLLGRFPDRALISVSSLLMVGAFALLLVSTAAPVFVLAQVLQGAGRAIFWTSSQAHAIRGSDEPVRRLVDVNLAGNVGTLSGPAIAGMLAAVDLSYALVAASIGAAAAAIGAWLLQPLEPFDRRRSAGTLRLLRRDGVDVACWASAVGGGWWSMMGSFVPIILVGAGIGPQGIGWLITASEAAGMVALLVLRRVPAQRIRVAVRVGAALAIVALIVIAIAPTGLVGYAVLLVIGGAGSGTVTALSSAMASLAAGPHEQGDALALAGMFRAGALFASPGAVGLMLGVVSLPAALVALGLALGSSGVVVGRRGRTRVAA